MGDRAIVGGGYDGSTWDNNVISYFTMSTLGDANDFGDLLVGRGSTGACSNGINDRGVHFGGYKGSNLADIEYVTISTNGNSVSFGDAINNQRVKGALSNWTNERAVHQQGGAVNVLNYVTISTEGNSADFGDLLAVGDDAAAFSNADNFFLMKNFCYILKVVKDEILRWSTDR